MKLTTGYSLLVLSACTAIACVKMPEYKVPDVPTPSTDEYFKYNSLPTEAFTETSHGKFEQNGAASVKNECDVSKEEPQISANLKPGMKQLESWMFASQYKDSLKVIGFKILTEIKDVSSKKFEKITHFSVGEKISSDGTKELCEIQEKDGVPKVVCEGDLKTNDKPKDVPKPSQICGFKSESVETQQLTGTYTFPTGEKANARKSIVKMNGKQECKSAEGQVLSSVKGTQKIVVISINGLTDMNARRCEFTIVSSYDEVRAEDGKLISGSKRELLEALK